MTNLSNIKLHLTTSNGTLFESNPQLWEISGFLNEFIKEALENMEEQNEEVNYVHVPLENISNECFVKVVEFLDIYNDNPNSWVSIEKPIKSTNVYDIVPTIYADYINELSEEEVVKLVSVADYLDITPLIDLASVKIATLLKPYYDNGSKEELRRILGINI